MARSFVLLLLVLLVSASAQDDIPPGLSDCSAPLRVLRTCRDVIMVGASPTADCCGSFNFLKQYWGRCFCTFLQQSAIESSPVYTLFYANLLQAAVVCRVPHGISDCPAVLGLPPDSADAQIFEEQLDTSSDASLVISSDGPAGSPSSSLPWSRGTSLAAYRLGALVGMLMGSVAGWVLA